MASDGASDAGRTALAGTAGAKALGHGGGGGAAAAGAAAAPPAAAREPPKNRSPAAAARAGSRRLWVRPDGRPSPAADGAGAAWGSCPRPWFGIGAAIGAAVVAAQSGAAAAAGDGGGDAGAGGGGAVDVGGVVDTNVGAGANFARSLRSCCNGALSGIRAVRGAGASVAAAAAADGNDGAAAAADVGGAAGAAADDGADGVNFGPAADGGAGVGV